MNYLTDKLVGQENVKRALEITLAGDHNLTLVNSEGDGAVSLTQMEEYESFLIQKNREFINYFNAQDSEMDVLRICDSSFKAMKSTHIFVEIAAPSFAELTSKRRQEPYEDIFERAMKARSNREAINKTKLNESCMTIFKVAYERLNMEPYEINIILSVAQTIAALDRAKIIEAQHIAEAIQYRSVDDRH